MLGHKLVSGQDLCLRSDFSDSGKSDDDTEATKVTKAITSAPPAASPVKITIKIPDNQTKNDAPKDIFDTAKAHVLMCLIY